MADDILHTIVSLKGDMIRVTAKQWAHIVESHDYMAGNMDKVLETLVEPDRVLEGKQGESLALRFYETTNVTSKTAVVVYRDELDGFLITAFLTSRAERIERGKAVIWPKS
jgi:hypothetical protein